LTRQDRRTDRLPDRGECLAILRGAGCSEDVVSHCVAVSEVAVRIARRCDAVVELVEAGALLHDIGRSRSHAIDHAVRGAELARELGLPDAVVLIIERHIGAGIPKDQAVQLGLPARDFVPETIEEKIVAHADNLIAGGRRVTVQETVANLTRKGLTDAAERMKKMHSELSEAAGIDIDSVV
jgi:tRNA (cytidine56-2'-O)-methyltransferase